MAFEYACELDELPVGGMRGLVLRGEKVAVYRLEDGVYATQSSCTHVFANLTKGSIVDGHMVQCPLHRARFDIRTGCVMAWANFPPGIQVLNFVRGEKALRTYPVRIEGARVLVDVGN